MNSWMRRRISTASCDTCPIGKDTRRRKASRKGPPRRRVRLRKGIRPRPQTVTTAGGTGEGSVSLQTAAGIWQGSSAGRCHGIVTAPGRGALVRPGKVLIGSGSGRPGAALLLKHRLRRSHIGLFRPSRAPSPVRERVGVRGQVFPERSHPSPCPSPARERGLPLHPAVCEAGSLRRRSKRRRSPIPPPPAAARRH